MKTLEEHWFDYLLEDDKVSYFLEKLRNTDPQYFFVTVKNKEEIINYVETTRLKNRDDILEILQKNTEVTEEDRLLSYRYSPVEKEFIRFLWNQLYFDDNDLLDRHEYDMLWDVLYTDSHFDTNKNKLVLSSTGNNEILQGVTFKRVDGKIVGFIKDVLDPNEPDVLHIKYLYIEGKHRKSGYATQLVSGLMNVKQYKNYSSHIVSPVAERIFEKLGFECSFDSDDKLFAIKRIPENPNTMKIIGNGHGYMHEKSFIKATEGMSDFEWRTNPFVIELIEKRRKEIVYLHQLKNKTPEQVKRLKDLTKHGKDWLHFSIDEVDLTKQWGLSEYDGAISVKYIGKNTRFINFLGYI